MDIPVPPERNEKNLDEVITYFENRLKDQQIYFYYEQLGFAYLNKKNYLKAYENLNKAIPLHQWYGFPFYAAFSAKEVGKYDKVTALYEQAIKRTSGNDKYSKSKKYILYAKKRSDK